MADIIQIRRDTAANWTSASPTLANGELGVETDTQKIKIGNGSTAWASLSYLIDVGSYLTATSTTTLTNKTIAFADNTLTNVAGTTAAQTLTNKTIAFADNTLTNVAGTTAAQTLTNKTIVDTIYALSGTALLATNGAIQTKTVGAAITLTDSLVSGDAIVLMLEGGASYTVTWPTMTWVTSSGNVAPTLTAKDTIVLWKVSSVLYGAYTGSYV